MARILVTGGAGFLGSHLVDHLVGRDHEVVALDSLETGRAENLSGHSSELLQRGDIADGSWLRSHFTAFRPEVVVHAAAAFAGAWAWARDVRTNTIGSALVGSAAAAAGAARILYLQTGLCYGLRPKLLPTPATASLDPGGSSYAISKSAGELYLALAGPELLSFRLANIYGPRNLSGPIPAFYQRLSTGGPCVAVESSRDFVFVNDLMKLLVDACEGTGRAGYYNAASGRETSIPELHRRIAALVAPDAPPPTQRSPGPDDAPRLLLDPTETTRVFGWAAHTPLDEGLPPTIAFYRKQASIEAYSHLELDKEL